MSDVEAVKNLVTRHKELRQEIAKKIIGQQEVVDQILLSVLFKCTFAWLQGRNNPFSLFNHSRIFSPFHILLPVILLILPCQHMVEPFGIFQVPVDGLLQTFGKGDGLAPSQLILQLGAVDGIPHIMTGTVFHESDQLS